MTLADKISILRKQSGWSQDDLAEKLNVSRQSVSKWESAQSIPDIQRIIQLSEIFGVTTDYLLKDEESSSAAQTTDESLPLLSLREATSFLDASRRYSRQIAFGVLLCVLSPIALIFLSGLGEQSTMTWTEDTGSAIGLGVLLVLIAIAVFIFLMSSAQMKQYEPKGLSVRRRGHHGHSAWESGEFVLAYGVEDSIRDQQSGFLHRYSIQMAVGVCLCIISVVPMLVCGALHMDDMIVIDTLVLMLALIAIACYLLVSASIYKSSLDQLLHEGDFRLENREQRKTEDLIGAIYWPIVTAIYLAWSFWTADWHITWIIWPVAGCAFAGVSALVQWCGRRK